MSSDSPEALNIRSPAYPDQLMTFEVLMHEADSNSKISVSWKDTGIHLDLSSMFSRYDVSH